MLETSPHAALAREFDAAERSRVQDEQFSRRHPGMTMADSCAIQREWVRLQCAGGRRVIGHKIGLTSRAMQIASKITEPDDGTLLDSMLLRDGSEVEAARFIVPRFELEFAFILARPLEGPAQGAGHHRRQRSQRRHRARRPADAPRCAGLALGRCAAVQERRGRGIGPGAAVLNHPANGVAWLANKLSAHGEHLAAGEIVPGGSFTRPVACAAGDTFHAGYGPLGSICLRFV